MNIQDLRQGRKLARYASTLQVVLAAKFAA
jgi:hypothetical protein